MYKKIQEYLARKTILIGSMIATSLYFISHYLIKSNSSLCIEINKESIYDYWETTCHLANILSFIAFPLFLFY